MLSYLCHYISCEISYAESNRLYLENLLCSLVLPIVVTYSIGKEVITHYNVDLSFVYFLFSSFMLFKF